MNKSKALKKEVIEIIESLPDDSTLEDIQYHLYVREKVERGMKSIGEGKIVSQKDAEHRVNRRSSPRK